MIYAALGVGGDGMTIHSVFFFGNGNTAVIGGAATLTMTLTNQELPPGSKTNFSLRNGSGSAKTVVISASCTWTNVADLDEIMLQMIHVQNTSGTTHRFTFPDSTVD